MHSENTIFSDFDTNVNGEDKLFKSRLSFELSALRNNPNYIRYIKSIILANPTQPQFVFPRKKEGRKKKKE